MKNKNWYKYLVFVIVCLTAGIGNYSIAQLSCLSTRIINELNITSQQFSSLVTFNLVSALVLSIPAGILATKFGTKKICSIGVVIGTIAYVARAFVRSYEALLISVIFGGVGSQMINALAVRIISTWFNEKQAGTMYGIFVSIYSSIAILAMTITSYSPTINSAFVVLAIYALVSCCLFLIFYKEGDIANNEKEISIKDASMVVLKNKYIIAICVIIFLGGGHQTVTNMMSLALQSKGVQIETAGMYVAILNAGHCIGALIGPIIAEKIGNRKNAVVGFVALACLFVISIVLLPTGAWSPIHLLITGAVMSPCFAILPSFPMFMKGLGPKYTGFAGGLICTFQNLGGVVIPTYCIAPFITNDNTLYLKVAACCMAAMVILIMLFVPDIDKKEA